MQKVDSILIIVESATKAKTITSALTSSVYNRATVISTNGHIAYLGDGGPAFNSGIYPDRDFKMNFITYADKNRIVSSIEEIAKTVDKVFIMTNPDSDGIVLYWSIMEFCNIQKTKCFRTIANELTTDGIVKAIENPVPVSTSMISAELSRIAIDKLIGYGLSPICKKYIGAKSIGRNQFIGLKLVSDREREISNFMPTVYYKPVLVMKIDGTDVETNYVGYQKENKNTFTNKADATAVLTHCSTAKYFVKSIERTERIQRAPSPFCTATFLKAAADECKISPKIAMNCAKKLFEGIKLDGKCCGLITFPNTEATVFCDDFNQKLKKYVISAYGSNCCCANNYLQKQISSEAIRITNLEVTPEILSKYIADTTLLDIYTLIWNSTVASVMTPSKIETICYTIENSGHTFTISTAMWAGDGYRKVYNNEKESMILNIPTDIVVGTELEVSKFDIHTIVTKPKCRFTEASLIAKLYDEKVGKQFSYVDILDKLLNSDRGYASLKDGYIIPTDRGMQLINYCNRTLLNVLSLANIKAIESELAKAANNYITSTCCLENFYNKLIHTIDGIVEAGIETDNIDKICPKCKNKLVIRRSRFGKLFYGCSTYPCCDFTADLS